MDFLVDLILPTVERESITMASNLAIMIDL